jgi:hypothetical protein
VENSDSFLIFLQYVFKFVESHGKFVQQKSAEVMCNRNNFIVLVDLGSSASQHFQENGRESEPLRCQLNSDIFQVCLQEENQEFCDVLLRVNEAMFGCWKGSVHRYFDEKMIEKYPVLNSTDFLKKVCRINEKLDERLKDFEKWKEMFGEFCVDFSGSSLFGI